MLCRYILLKVALKSLATLLTRVLNSLKQRMVTVDLKQILTKKYTYINEYRSLAVVAELKKPNDHAESRTLKTLGCLR